MSTGSELHMPASDLGVNYIISIPIPKFTPITRTNYTISPKKIPIPITCRTNCQIRNIGRIQPHLTKESCKTIVHTQVTSRLDYGNALYGLPQTALQTELCCSPHYPYKEIRTHYTRVGAFILAARSFAANLQSAFLYLLCFKWSGAGLPG